jgi:hypothetical protein
MPQVPTDTFFSADKVNGLVEQDAGGVKMVVRGRTDKVSICKDVDALDVEKLPLFAVDEGL